MPQNRGEYSNRMNANQQNQMSTPIRTSSLRNFFQHNQEIQNQAAQRLNAQQGLGGLDPRTVNPLNSPIAQGPRSRFTLNQPTAQNNNAQNNNARNNNPQNNNNNRTYRTTNIVDSMERNRKRLNKNSNINNNNNVNLNFVRSDLFFQPQTRLTTTPLPPDNSNNSRSASSNNSNRYTAIDNNTSNRAGATKVKNEASSSNAPTRRDDLKNAFSSLDKEFNGFQENLKKSRSWTINKRDEKYNAINSSSENRTKDKELVPQTPKSRQPSPSLGNRPKF